VDGRGQAKPKKPQFGKEVFILAKQWYINRGQVSPVKEFNENIV